ncbi:polyphosphate--glucose phosphotransferase [Anaerolinea sp.]|uniref:polyphosphate--glucose phosphotransferase n=1 Tax=Anaerolinea sp. TaxID=1872519 RepID=UPI002ACE64C3|nr:ROK family protein [Anaerolinea sp.]
MEILGIDIGGSGIKGAPVDVETGQLTAERYRLPTPENALPEEVALVVAQIVEHFQWKGRVGAGFPAAIKHGVAQTAANIHPTWIGLHAGNLFSEKCGCPVSVLNDADAAGLAEMTFGAGKGQKGVVLMITIGTGIGTALFTDGILVPNTELGHIEIRGKDAEQRSSEAARQRKDWTWQQWAKRLNEHLERLEALFWPDLFILGGGAVKNHEKFFPYLKLRTPFVAAKLGNLAGIVGAAWYAHTQETQA